MFRKMRRFKQELSAEKCAEILQTEPRGVLAVLGDGGYPYTVPLDIRTPCRSTSFMMTKSCFSTALLRGIR